MNEQQVQNTKMVGTMMYVLASATDIIVNRFQRMLLGMNLQFSHEKKQRYEGAKRALKQAEYYLDQVDEVAISISEDGLENTFNSLLYETNDIIRLIMLWENATYKQPENILKIESMLKVMAKEQMYPSELVDTFHVKH